MCRIVAVKYSLIPTDSPTCRPTANEGVARSIYVNHRWNQLLLEWTLHDTKPVDHKSAALSMGNREVNRLHLRFHSKYHKE